MKLALIIDSSDAFINFQKELVLDEWGVSDTQGISSLSEAGNATLFGPAPTSVLRLESTEHVKKVLKEIQEHVKNDTLKDKCSSGVIITSSLNKNSTRALTKTLEPHARVLLGKSSNLTETIVKNYMSLNEEAEMFLINYLGQDYNAAIPLARSIRKLPQDQQKKISIESLYYRLPKPPGGIPPWEIEDPLWDKDYPKTVEVYRRITSNSGALLPLFILNKKVRLIFRCAALLEDNPRISLKEVSEILGVPNNYPLKLAFGKAKQLGVARAEKIALILSETERKLKGGGSGPEDIVVELALLDFIKALKAGV